MKYKTILLLILLGLISSVILTFIPIQEACGQNGGCYAVQASDYESTLGFKNAHLGIVAFSTLLIITFLHDRKSSKKMKNLIGAGLTIGSIMALYFLYLQIFVINAFCKYCMVTDLGLLLALATFFFVKDKKEKQIPLTE